ncbi:thioredoxin-dependent thiol peroxidase [bacterium]|nr:thioredoxin-dependent thiol peroxidase [bacterium]
MSLLTVGEPAPRWSLVNQSGQIVNLEDFKDKKTVVVYFYPKALTPGCTAQACGIRDSHTALEKHNTVVFGISPDPVSKLQKFIDKHELNFDLLSDEDHVVAEYYGCWGLKKFMGKEFMGIIRTSFVIDPSLNVASIMTKFKTASHHETLLETLESFKD